MLYVTRDRHGCSAGTFGYIFYVQEWLKYGWFRSLGACFVTLPPRFRLMRGSIVAMCPNNLNKSSQSKGGNDNLTQSNYIT
jgi:hypothetical protein